jgi:hypothetical protein
MNLGSVHQRSPFDGIIETFPYCGNNYQILQEIDYNYSPSKSQKVDPYILEQFIKFSHKPAEREFSFIIWTSNYNLIRLHKLSMIIEVQNSLN